jgi:hypothetical protein
MAARAADRTEPREPRCRHAMVTIVRGPFSDFETHPAITVVSAIRNA